MPTIPRRDVVVRSRVRRRDWAEIKAAAALTEQTVSELVRAAVLTEARRLLAGGGS